MTDHVAFVADQPLNLAWQPGSGIVVEIAHGPRESRRPVQPGETFLIPAILADEFEAKFGAERPGDASHSGHGRPLISGLRRIG